MCNESSVVRTTVGRIAPMECTYADVLTALFADLDVHVMKTAGAVRSVVNKRNM